MSDALAVDCATSGGAFTWEVEIEADFQRFCFMKLTKCGSGILKDNLCFHLATSVITFVFCKEIIKLNLLYF